MVIARFRSFLGNVSALNGVRNIFSSSRTTETPVRGSSHDEAARLLFKRISPLGDPTVSLAPVLDQWVHEGHELHRSNLTSIIKELRSFRRYSHALQISMWMSKYINLTPSDISVRLDLISKVHGIEEAENYFNSIPVHQRGLEVYGAFLNCYADAKCVEKGENLMHKMRDLGLARGSLVYSVLLGLYKKTGNYEKMESLIQEMEEKHIRFTSHIYSILISAYAAKSDTCRIEEILKKAESDNVYGRNWSIYTTAAQGYMEVGLMDKAVMALRNAEKFITNDKRNSLGYEILITLYSKAGCRDDVLRIWDMYSKRKRVLNRGYIGIISSLLKLDDLESAEKVFEEWKSKGLALDIRIPNLLIASYCTRGLVEKAKALIEEMTSKGAELNQRTWFYLANYYLKEGRYREAVEAMKESLKLAIATDILDWTRYKDVVVACLKFLKEEGNTEETQEFVRLVEQTGNVSPDISQLLLQDMSGEKQNEPT